MNWMIVVLVVLSLLGSILWVMPSPYQRYQAKIRREAMMKGLQVQMVQLLFPRQQGEAAPEERACIAYRLPRKLSKDGIGRGVPWHIFKADAFATEGLPSGWCWSKGEGYLGEEALAIIGEALDLLPKQAFSLESTPIALSVYWHESGEPDALERIFQGLERLRDSGL